MPPHGGTALLWRHGGAGSAARGRHDGSRARHPMWAEGSRPVAGARAEARVRITAAHTGAGSGGCFVCESCRLEDPWLWCPLPDPHRLGSGGHGCSRGFWLQAAIVSRRRLLLLLLQPPPPPPPPPLLLIVAQRI
jgi:hypothetical protein